ncbi:unnamed protein product [Schistosoma bovis]|nr:unnamed protein product [Schistosoma bovis]
MTDSSYYDYKPNSMNHNEGYKTKSNEHYDKHKVNYEQYFKNYDQYYHRKHKHHHHHHHHHHHRHHDHDHGDHDHNDHDHDHSHEHSSKEDNNPKTISSEWIYDKLKEYLTCIYEKQINCEDQFVTELQLKLLKMQSNKQKNDEHYESISSEHVKQIPIISVEIDKTTLETKHEDDHTHPEHQHKEEHKEMRKDSSTIYQTKNNQFEISKHKEIEQTEKFYSHESYQSLDNDKYSSYYHNDHHERHYPNLRHHQNQHQHHPPLDHHRHKDHHDRDHHHHQHHHRSSSYYKDGWLEKLDKMLPSLDDDDNDDDDDEHRHKHKDKHPHHHPMYRKYSNKY